MHLKMFMVLSNLLHSNSQNNTIHIDMSDTEFRITVSEAASIEVKGVLIIRDVS